MQGTSPPLHSTTLCSQGKVAGPVCRAGIVWKAAAAQAVPRLRGDIVCQLWCLLG